ncbi:MAG: response regulator [Gammaproteobacteria bacterium]|nr:response regulator [Gammaproteobacteria bacterium]
MAGANLLLVDDEVSFVEILAKRLTLREFNISTAHSGAEALERLQTDPDIDVVILDLVMPDMDGIETMKRIKQKRPLVEVIMLSGVATVESAIEGMELGAFDYLLKSSEIDTLIEKVMAAVARKRVHEEKIAKARLTHLNGRHSE